MTVRLPLREHRGKILASKRRLDTLLANLDKTIAGMEGESIMTDKEKFERVLNKA